MHSKYELRIFYGYDQADKKKLEAQGPCTGHRSIIAILYCFSFEYMKSTQIYVD